MAKTILSFYLDDTNPYNAPAEALGQFLDFCAGEGVRGESSVILGYSWGEHGLISRPASVNQERFIEQARRSFDCGVDTHFELFTHAGRFDFASSRIPEGAIHEGLWLYEPAVSAAEYEAYFRAILDEGERVGITYTGMTWPGCGCDACVTRYETLRQQGVRDPNPAMWQALLSLAKQGRFRGKTVPCFFGGALEDCKALAMASDGGYGVFDLAPNAEDRCGLWLNTPGFADVDYYISADGRSGRIVDLVRREAPYCLFYAHWQGLNPANGVGWGVFTELARRVKRHLDGEVTWMTPSEYTGTLMK